MKNNEETQYIDIDKEDIIVQPDEREEYSIRDVAQILGANEKNIKFLSVKFDKELDGSIDKPYSRRDLITLSNIHNLYYSEDKSIREIKKSLKEARNLEVVKRDETTNKLVANETALDILSGAIAKNIETQMQQIKKELISELKLSFKQDEELQRQYIKELNSQLEELRNKLEISEKERLLKDKEIMKYLKTTMETKKQGNENKGFFKRLFGK